MTETVPPGSEPRPLAGAICFEEADFRSLGDPHATDPEANGVRLAARRRLLTLGKSAAAACAAEGTKLDCRTSLHHPHRFNGNRVRRLWAYLTRPKGEKRRLRSLLGAELAKDLDAAYRNAYLCLAMETDALEVSLRIHPDAWYDGQNLKNKVERSSPADWLAELNRLPGFRLRLHDWKGEWRCGELEPEQLEEFLGYYVPGDHALAVERRWPAPPRPAPAPSTRPLPRRWCRPSAACSPSTASPPGPPRTTTSSSTVSHTGRKSSCQECRSNSAGPTRVPPPGPREAPFVRSRSSWCGTSGRKTSGRCATPYGWGVRGGVRVRGSR